VAKPKGKLGVAVLPPSKC